MKKVLFILVPMFFLCCYSFSQNYISIKHIGIKDAYIPNLLIINENSNQNGLDSNSAYYKSLSPVVIKLDSNKYKTFKKVFYKKSFFEKGIKNIMLGTFEIVVGVGDKKRTLFISNLKSDAFFRLVLTELKKNSLDDKLIMNLELIVNSI